MNFQNAVKSRKYRLIAKKTKKEALKLSCAGFILIALSVMSYGLAEKYNLSSKLESEPVYIKINEVKAEPVELEMDQEKQRVEELAEGIWTRESTRGKNNYSKCEAIGKINGIGYGIYKDAKGIQHWQCFENHEEEMEVLRDWIIRKQKTMSEQEFLSLYSGGSYNRV